MNDCTRQRTGPGSMSLMSASQLKQAGCLRRWGFVRLMGLREPQGEAAAKGSRYHGEMEAWGRFGTIPTSRPALAALKYASSPGLAEIEVPVRFDTANSSWVGYIDEAHDITPGTSRRPVGTTGHTVILDWKFTGSLRNAMSEDGLFEDSAANLYAYEAFLGGAKLVTCKWVYVQMSGSATTLIVEVPLPRDHVMRVVEQLDKEAHELQKLYRQYRGGLLNVLDLPTNTSKCFAYRQRCPHTDICKPELKFDITGADMVDFKAAMTANFPGIPPLPTMAPPIPPVPEAGFINPPEAPKVAARSPEHAAELQGIAKPVAPAAAPADDLDVLTREQLKALAVQLGVVSNESKAREATLRATIRAFRERRESPAERLTMDLEQKTIDVSLADPEILAYDPATAKPFGGQDTDAFTLFINCSPRADTDYTILPFPTLLDLAHEELREEHPELKDYRQIPYTAAGELSVAVKKVFKDPPWFFDAIVVDTNTPEGSAVVVALESLAAEIVRGF